MSIPQVLLREAPTIAGSVRFEGTFLNRFRGLGRDAVARDPNRPTHILATFDSGDHLHPQDDGYKAMADSIDLKMLTTKP
jgi:uncharacterized protein (AIM24 family)